MKVIKYYLLLADLVAVGNNVLVIILACLAQNEGSDIGFNASYRHIVLKRRVIEKCKRPLSGRHSVKFFRLVDGPDSLEHTLGKVLASCLHDVKAVVALADVIDKAVSAVLHLP